MTEGVEQLTTFSVKEPSRVLSTVGLSPPFLTSTDLTFEQ